MPTNKRFLRKCREATEAGADGVVPQQNPARRRLGTTPPARPFLEFDGLAGTPPNLGVSRTVLLAGPITERKSTGRKQRTYRPTSLKGEFKRSPANSFTPSPSAPAKEASRHFIDGAATPPNPGGEFRFTFRVHDRSHNEVQNCRRNADTIAHNIRKMANLQ